MSHVFLVDTSMSMTQKMSKNLSFLEVAKNFVETYINTRFKLPEAKGDKFFVFSTSREKKTSLVDFAHYGELTHVINELRGFTACYHCDMFLSLKEILDYLNAFRVISAADNYFGGREILKAETTNVNIFFNGERCL
jgi:hypothetical protein